MSNISRHPVCKHRSEIGNCLTVGGFCTAVPTSVCEAERSKSMSDSQEGHICEFCYYQDFDVDAYPCSRCICNKPIENKWKPKEQEHGK